MKKIVLSGISLYQGGTLSIYYDLLDSAVEKNIYNEYEVVCFVHDKNLFKKYMNYFEIIEIPKARKNYLYRLFYEYIFFYFYSKKQNIYIWFSVHDITPNVKAQKQFTYCHNPMMFYKMRFSDVKYAGRLFWFNLFYKYLYKINIKKNDYVVVQQEWIREKFKQTYKINNVLVATPNIDIKYADDINICNKDSFIFLFPSFPAYFKNFESICEAVKIINSKHLKAKYKVILTINSGLNKYSNDLLKKYKDVENIEWTGILDRKKLFDIYKDSDCMIFPSRLETWGLPISEYKSTGKPIILIDLPYTHETIGSYDKVAFFEPDNNENLANIMIDMILNNGKNVCKRVTKKNLKLPNVDSWEKFWELILQRK